MTDRPALKRSLSLPLITLYGLGTTVGAGVYVLTGKVAMSAGLFAPISFLVASFLAASSAVAFAELASRFPKSAGEAVYVFEGLHYRTLSILVGLMVVFAGIVSSATIANGFVGYFHEFVDSPEGLTIAVLVLVLGLIAAWGITESVLLAALITLLEIGGLALVIWVGHDALADLPARLPELLPPFETLSWMGILTGSVLAFYAFIGFEDMVNVAEEVKDAPRTMPRAILLTLLVTTLLYLGVALVSVLVLPLDELATSEAPLAAVYGRATGSSATVISVISLFAVLNGALIQIIMAARVLYGLSAQGWLPAGLGRIHPWTRTPLLATGAVAGAVLVFALLLPLVTLAQATSLITLSIFALVNLSLFRIKRRDPRPPGVTVFPLWVPLVGFLVSVGFIVFALGQFFT
jgi:amino acid transporter